MNEAMASKYHHDTMRNAHKVYSQLLEITEEAMTHTCIPSSNAALLTSLPLVLVVDLSRNVSKIS